MAQPKKVRRFAKPTPQFEVIQGRGWSEDWKNRQCDLTLAELVDLQDTIRAIAIIVNSIHERSEAWKYSDVLDSIERQINSSQLGLVGLASTTDHALQTIRIILNIGRVLPRRENCEMVQDFYDRLKERQAQLARPHLIPAKQQAVQS